MRLHGCAARQLHGCMAARLRNTKAACALAPKHPRIEGLRNVTSNTALNSGLVQPIDYLRYKRHALSDWSIVVPRRPISTVLLVSST